MAEPAPVTKLSELFRGVKPGEPIPPPPRFFVDWASSTFTGAMAGLLIGGMVGYRREFARQEAEVTSAVPEPAVETGKAQQKPLRHRAFRAVPESESVMGHFVARLRQLPKAQQEELQHRRTRALLRGAGRLGALFGAFTGTFGMARLAMMEHRGLDLNGAPDLLSTVGAGTLTGGVFGLAGLRTLGLGVLVGAAVSVGLGSVQAALWQLQSQIAPPAAPEAAPEPDPPAQSPAAQMVASLEQSLDAVNRAIDISKSAPSNGADADTKKPT